MYFAVVSMIIINQAMSIGHNFFMFVLNIYIKNNDN